MKNKLKIAAAQFETRDGDKDYNLKKMEDLIGRAAREGADAISFHELCTTGYTFLKNLDRESLMRLAEEIPEGVTTQNLISLAGRYDIVVLAGVLERVRWLAAEGTTFQNTKDQLRRDLAIELLNKTTLPVAAIGSRLGFQDAAAFNRAFRHWTGSAPGAYRKRPETRPPRA